jgi:Family of unknown function (DUF6994)
MHIDITFDFRSDTPRPRNPDAPPRDPDTCSPTLRRYHKALWSKKVPKGGVLTLEEGHRGHYLYHWSEELGEFSLSSDAVVPSFSREQRMASVIEQIPPDDLRTFNSLGYTIGGMMLFPGNRINRKMELNSARGCHPRIKDRFDLTVECIRRHYCHEASPLGEVIQRYAGFFDLFRDFGGYVEYFLLQDLVSEDYSTVRFFAPFEDFGVTSPLPGSVDAYRDHRRLAMDFLEARNLRIAALNPLLSV